MKVLVVHPRLSVLGGGERVALHSIRALLNRGNDVYLLSEEFDVGRFEDFFGCQGLFDKVKRLSYPPFEPGWQKVLLYRRMRYHEKNQKKVLSQNRDLKFDLVVSTQDVSYAPSVGAPIVQYCYFPEYFGHLATNPGSKPWRLYYMPASLFYKRKVDRIDTLLSVSDYSKDYIRKVWDRDAITLYPPCPTEEYGSVGGQRENLVITTGRIVPEKRYDLFFEMARSFPDVRFVVIGSLAEEKRPYYERLTSDLPKNAEIILAPLRKNKDLLARAKVYVHCMENEHFGITIVEAMAAGVVPVVHDSGGPREIVTEQTGLRWREIPEAVAEIARLLGNEELRCSMSTAGRERAKLYSDEAYESRFDEIMENSEKQLAKRKS